ncbi:putative disease resistance protein At4g19050 [Syzygium oleosum]|uniref:putative disease resistance protein At4g19050 n=1 Tax=Syzygium oleosum TaxID=219896 RepID=UPI0011D28F9B|nr:putative disease resistance protein At4g19050 [Syzygium oleosum]
MANPKNSPETRKADILDLLSDDSVKTVVLFGEAGVGKTWMAKEISNSVCLNGSSYGTIWVVPGYDYEGQSLLEKFAIQLSVLPSNEKWEEDDNAEMEQQEQEVDLDLKQGILEKLKLMKSAKLAEMKTAKPEEKKSEKPKKNAKMEDFLKYPPGTEKDPYLLAVLDDFIDIKPELLALSDFLSRDGHLLKVLITRSGSDIGIGNEGNGDTIQTDGERFYKIEVLSHVESSNLLGNRVKAEVSRATGFERLSAAIGKVSSGHPGAIIIIAEAINHVNDSELDKAVEEAASIIESADIKTVMQHVYKMLPSTLNKCCWHCRFSFLQRDSIHYNELITHWLLEGYFDHHDHVEMAYEEAHHTLMELKDRGFLRVKENGYVYMDSDALGVTDHRRDGLSGSACVGVASVLHDQTWAGLGRVVQTDGMIKTSCGKGSEMSTLLIDGARFCREVPETFFQRIQQLKVLVILHPKFKKLPLPLSKLKELQVLVLRGCRLLENVDEICELTNLLVLEISGACFVKEINDDLFELMKDLRSLNLSEVGIKWLPASVLNRGELRWLILRNCPNLEKLCDDKLLKKKEVAKQEMLSLAKLEVLDLSGSYSFRSTLVKTISPLKKLQTLNLSKTSIARFPFFHDLQELTRLLLSDCPFLSRLPSLKPLLKLEILDLAKTTSLKEVQDDPQETKTEFRVLDLTGSTVNKLPCNFSSLSHLLLSGCVGLPKLPSTKGLQSLEELNLSDASILEEFKDESFEHLNSLRRLILSNTKITALPSLSKHSELRLLSLKNCKLLTKLQNLSTLQKLEVLDLSGCSKLEIARNDSFWGMAHLKTINLSETKIESLPSNCFPISLCHLIMRNCTSLNDLPSLEALLNLEVLNLCGAKSLSNIKLEFLRHMSKLRILNLSEIEFEQLPSLSHLTNLRELSLTNCSCKVSKLDALKELELLDLSGTKVESLPTLETFSNLQQLLLRDCADLESLENLKSLTELEVLDLSGTKIKEFPYEISDLTSLRKLNLLDTKHIKEIDWKKIKYIPEEFNLGGCRSLSSEIAASSDWPSISICGTSFFQFVEKNPKLWDTCFQKFHFSIWLPKNSDGRIDNLGDRGLLVDIKSQGRFPHHKEPGRYLEIHGSYCEFSLPEHVLEHADNISLMDDSSLRHLSELVKENLRSIKSCWLDRCTDIRSIVDGEEDARASGKLDCLYLCNLSSLRSVCDDKVHSEVFGGLKSLYVDCCPMLADVFSLSKLPKKLENLQIKFCEKMEKLFNPGMSEKCNLQTLDLLELPKLEIIGVKMVSLRVLKVRQCQNLKNLEEVLGEAENLEILHISHAARLKTICSREVKPGSFENLKQLKIESCPQLKEVSPSSESLPNLEILEINSCKSLETIFTGSSSASSLKRLRLRSLPSLSKTVFKVPPQCQVDFNCPNLQIDRSG